MAFNGSGTFLRAMNWVADAASGVKIRADRHDIEDDNFAAGLSNVITKDGQTTVTQNIPFNSKRLINVADPVNAQDAVTKNWLSTLGEFNLLKFLTPDMSIIGRSAGTPAGSVNRIAFNDKPDGTGTDVFTITETGATTAQTRNRIVNPAMQISQENGNTSTASPSAYYVADQWFTGGATTGTVTSQRVQVVTPNKSVNRIRSTITVADISIAAGEYFNFLQPIEGIRLADFAWGTASARQVILRFGLKAPAGSYTVTLRNGAANRTYAALVTITAGQANTDTEQILVIPGDTTGTWTTDTNLGLYLTLCFVSGSTNTAPSLGWQAGNFIGAPGMTNGMANAGNVFELFDVALYLDPQATGAAPAWVMPDEADELAACQRYWERCSAGISMNGLTGFFNSAPIYFKATKRIVPAANATNGTLVLNCSAPTFGEISTDSCLIGVTATANGGLYNRGIVATFNARM